MEQGPPVQSGVTPEVLTTIALAIQQQQQACMRYQAWGGAVSQRIIDCYGMVYQSHCWYAVAYCHLRGDLRTFRLDRVLEIELLENTFAPPAGFNAWQVVEQAIATTPHRYQAEILLQATLEEAQAQIPATLGILTAVEAGIRVKFSVENLGWLARFLLDLTSPLSIVHPPELRQEMQRLQARITEMLK